MNGRMKLSGVVKRVAAASMGAVLAAGAVPSSAQCFDDWAGRPHSAVILQEGVKGGGIEADVIAILHPREGSVFR